MVAKRPMLADACSRNCGVVLQESQQRTYGALRKIGALEEAARLIDGGSKLEGA